MKNVKAVSEKNAVVSPHIIVDPGSSLTEETMLKIAKQLTNTLGPYINSVNTVTLRDSIESNGIVVISYTAGKVLPSKIDDGRLRVQTPKLSEIVLKMAREGFQIYSVSQESGKSGADVLYVDFFSTDYKPDKKSAVEDEKKKKEDKKPKEDKKKEDAPKEEVPEEETEQVEEPVEEQPAEEAPVEAPEEEAPNGDSKKSLDEALPPPPEQSKSSVIDPFELAKRGNLTAAFVPSMVSVYAHHEKNSG